MTSPTVPVEMDVADALAFTCQELDSQVMAVSDEQAARFFQVFTLDSLFRAFTSPALQPAQEGCVLSVLGKLLKTLTGAALLPQAVPYLDVALVSPKVPLRRMAVQQYGALLAQQGQGQGVGESMDTEGTGSAVAGQLHLLTQLLSAVKDRDTGVAHQAAQALASWACLHPSNACILLDPAMGPLGCACRELAAGVDGMLRLRLLSLVSDVAAKGGPGVLAVVHTAGLLQSLLSKELSNAGSDPLSALSALTTVSELVERWSRPDAAVHSNPGDRPAAASLVSELYGAVVSALPQLLPDPLLLPGALGAAALLLRETLALSPTQRQGIGATSSGPHGNGVNGVNGNDGPSEGGSQGPAGGPMEVDLPDGAAGAQVHGDRGMHGPLLQALRDILDDRGTAGAEEEVAALDAAGKLAGSCTGAGLVLGDARVADPLLDRALGRTTPSPAVRIAALHALASAAGIDRAAEAGGASMLGPGAAPVGPLDVTAAWLPVAAEQVLRVGAYQAAASLQGPGGAGRSPCEALVSLAAQPVPELAVASYRAAAALALRPWFAAEMCGNVALLARVTDPASPVGPATNAWRQTLLAAMWTTCQAVSQLPTSHPDAVHQPTLASAVSRLQAALKAGSTGGAQAPTLHDTHMVATIP